MILIFRSFARSILKKVAKEKPKATEKPVAVASEDITKEWMAKRHVSINSLPKRLLVGAKSVFNHFPSKQVREWGYKIAQSYIEMNGIEKPSNITKVQPFATSIAMLDKKIESSHKRGYFKIPSEHSLASLESYDKPQKSEKLTEVKLQYQKEHAIGYAYKRMPSTFSSIFRIINEVKYRLPDFAPQSCLDFGAGTGAAAWAALECYPSLKSVVAVEPSKEMRTVGKKLAAKEPKIKWADSLATLPSVVEPEGLFDVVVCGYVLSEVDNAVTRNLIVDALWQRTKKIMIFVEPGTPKGSRLVYSVREWALRTMTREESSIVAPCPHDGNCPLAAHPKSWCHFSQFTAKYPKDVFPRVPKEVHSENEKFSYVVVHRGVAPRYYAKSELDVAEESFLWPRLVRPTIRRTKHVIADVCRVDKLERFVLSKGKTEKGIYRFLRKAHWGDLWPYRETKKTQKPDNN